MARYVLDANVLIDLFLIRHSAFRFFEDITDEDELISSLLLLPEATSVIRSEVFAKRAAIDDARLFIDRILQMPWHVITDLRQLARGFELAERFQKVKSYDMQYLAVAEMTSSTLVTRDRGLRHAASEIGVDVVFLT